MSLSKTWWSVTFSRSLHRGRKERMSDAVRRAVVWKAPPSRTPVSVLAFVYAPVMHRGGRRGGRDADMFCCIFLRRISRPLLLRPHRVNTAPRYK